MKKGRPPPPPRPALARSAPPAFHPRRAGAAALRVLAGRVVVLLNLVRADPEAELVEEHLAAAVLVERRELLPLPGLVHVVLHAEPLEAAAELVEVDAVVVLNQLHLQNRPKRKKKKNK